MSKSTQSTPAGNLRQRIDDVLSRCDLVALVGRVVKLGRGTKPRGKCPFHGSKSDSLAVDPERGRVRCWGCEWSGDAIRFVQDYHGLSFADALRQLEQGVGLDARAGAPVRREKRSPSRAEPEMIDSIVMARHLWAAAREDAGRVCAYLSARGVPKRMLGEDRFGDVRFAGAVPIVPWKVNARPDSVPCAPAIVALVRRPPAWRPIGIHVTFLAPDGLSKMARQRSDGSDYPARKMLGPIGGGCVRLGRFTSTVPLFVGEGLETVLSGMALLGAPDDACGLAALSLGNLQGRPRLWRGALPLYDPHPDPDAPAMAFRHAGVVTGLIDADMKPLRGPRDPRSGVWRGVPVVEARGGGIVRRTITSSERTALCGTLFARSWRQHGCRASAVRPHMGADFNDALRAAAA